MGPDEDDAVVRLGWAVRHYAWLLVLFATIGAGTASMALQPTSDPEYEASALIVAGQLDGIRAEHLPRMTHAIFHGNNVPIKAVLRGDLPIESDDLIPKYAEVETISGTVVTRVTGTAEDPDLAAKIANSAALALLDELNRLGPGVGTFSLQEAAQPPVDPVDPGMRIPPAILGAATGLVLAGGLVVLLLAVRRPQLSVDRVVTSTQLPLLGSLQVSRGRQGMEPRATAGIVATTTNLFPEGSEVVVVASPTAPAVRSQVALLVARTLVTTGRVGFVPSHDRAGMRTLAKTEDDPLIRVLPEPPATGSTRRPVVVDGESSLPVRSPLLSERVLVITEGTSQRSLAEWLRTYGAGGCKGIVWVQRRGWLRSLLQQVTTVEQRAIQLRKAGRKEAAIAPEHAPLGQHADG